MRNIILLLMPLAPSLATAQQAPDCGPGCDCATLPKIDGSNPQRLREMIDRVAEDYHQTRPEFPRGLAIRLLLEAVGEVEQEFQDTIQDEVAGPVWDDDQIVLFGSAELEDMINSTLNGYNGRHIHSFLKSVELLDVEAEADLDPGNYHELVDEVKGAMNVLERTYNSILKSGGDEEEAERAVQLGSMALVSVYGYASYVIFTAMVNFFAKVEMNNNG